MLLALLLPLHLALPPAVLRLAQLGLCGCGFRLGTLQLLEGVAVALRIRGVALRSQDFALDCASGTAQSGLCIGLRRRNHHDALWAGITSRSEANSAASCWAKAARLEEATAPVAVVGDADIRLVRQEISLPSTFAQVNSQGRSVDADDGTDRSAQQKCRTSSRRDGLRGHRPRLLPRMRQLKISTRHSRRKRPRRSWHLATLLGRRHPLILPRAAAANSIHRSQAQQSHRLPSTRPCQRFLPTAGCRNHRPHCPLPMLAQWLLTHQSATEVDSDARERERERERADCNRTLGW